MNQITEIVVASSLSILTALIGIVAGAVKNYLVTRGGKKALEVVEILAKNAVKDLKHITSH